MASPNGIERLDDGRPAIRRHPLSLVAAGTHIAAALRDVSGRGAWLETPIALRLGERVALHHPEAGWLEAEVSGLGRHGARLSFDHGEKAVAFALAAMAAEIAGRSG